MQPVKKVVLKQAVNGDADKKKQFLVLDASEYEARDFHREFP